MNGQLAGKIAVVTGGCSGIGLKSVELFINAGARVVVADILEEQGQHIQRRFGESVVFSRCDVRDEDDIARAVGVARHMGGPDIMFNNAGIAGPLSGILDTEVGDWDAAFAILLRGPMLGTQHAARAMRDHGRGGSIICTASIAAFSTGWGGLAYSAAKAALVHFCKVTAAELGQHLIRVNAICPGVTVTPIFDVTFGKSHAEAEEGKSRLLPMAARMQPIPRAGLDEDIARYALFLAGPDATFVTGGAHVVDGGASTGPRSAWDPEATNPMTQMFS